MYYYISTQLLTSSCHLSINLIIVVSIISYIIFFYINVIKSYMVDYLLLVTFT